MKSSTFYKWTIFLFLLYLAMSCAVDHDQIEQYQSIEKQGDYTVKKLKFSDLNSLPRIKETLGKLGRPKQSMTGRQIYESPYGFEVDLDDFIYIGDEKVHSYTFKILEDNPEGKLRNLVLKRMPNSTYEAFVFSYDLTAEDVVAANSGNPIKDFPQSTSVTYLGFNQPEHISANITIDYECVSTIIGQTYKEYTDENGVGHWEVITYYRVDCSWVITIGTGGNGTGTGTGTGTGPGTGDGPGVGTGGTVIGGVKYGGGTPGNNNGEPSLGGPYVIGGEHDPGYVLGDHHNPTLTLPFYGSNNHVKALNKLTKNNSDGSKTKVKEGIDALKSKLYTDHQEDGFHYIQNGDSYTVTVPEKRYPNKVEFADDDYTQPGTKVVMHMHTQQAEVATYNPETGEEVVTLEELVPIFSNGDIDKTAQQFVDVGQDPEFTSILVTVEGTFALRIGNSDAVRNFDGLMSQVRAAKKQFFKDFDNAVNIPCQGQANGCYIENFSDFINDYEINGGKIGLILFKAVEDNQGNITNWVKL